ncbi:hypothetical protein OPQ81_001204 [Rhizoctonia solani]|nr:hypothetical protein OPQ81_001204 [Rhizoctonia solani]
MYRPISTAKLVTLAEIALAQSDTVSESTPQPQSDRCVKELPSEETEYVSSLERNFESFLRSLRSEREFDLEDDGPLDAWGEGMDAQKLRDQRLHEQHKMWNTGTLRDHIHKSLHETGVFTEGQRAYWAYSTRLPTCVVLPSQRDLKQECLAREKRRFELNCCQVRMALLAAGGELSNSVQLSCCEEPVDNLTSSFKKELIEYEVIECVANRAIGNVFATSSPCQSAPIPISWEEYNAAWRNQKEMDQHFANWLESSKSTEVAESNGGGNRIPPRNDNENSGEKNLNREENTKDVIVDWVKKQELSVYQEIVLNRLIRPADMSTGFDSVHLPDLTMDAMRTLVSLRLVCPKAFHTGILKRYNMSGALLFGPPGTGKTHLVKAIAKESGARMISIRPTDILDNHITGKLIEALFNLARLLKPCIIFIDEMDALFGARLSNNDGYARWRSDMLTQFAQEMDGMLSSDVIVIGATNRPFDIDDAIIRRLPCRILVDLPDKNAREAILHLANLTPNFSGPDLKYVCVAAAFESVKELADIQWVIEEGKRTTLRSSALGKASLAFSDVSAKVSSPSSGETTESNLESRTRKLAKWHFTQALKQIRASTSETQSSLVELRRWNNEFGFGIQSSNIEGDTEEEVIERVKRQGLSQYQQEILSCLIRLADMPTGFDSVHLPDATIDAMRTLVSLRLVCPQAFHTGILKQHNMSGALLFGPPGTGKTHLVRTIAKESGARMWVGQTEKTIDALFRLAGLLKPCIIFIDEIDALFGARVSAQDGYQRWRTDMLTQFAQEMDGILSSDVIVIGATNRPFDLDDAIIRRLPCRILIDLPDKNSREAILRILLKDEQLEADVDLADLADHTPNFSGSDLKNVCITAAFDSAKELANISWTHKKGKSSSAIPALGIRSPETSYSGKASPANPDLDEGLVEFSSLSSDVINQFNPDSQTRKLARKHFIQALNQIQASTSEAQTSLVELRRWNDQFGSGNQSSRTGAYSVSGMSHSGSNRPRTNGPGIGTPGVRSSRTYVPSQTPGGNGAGWSMPGTSPTDMGTSGGNPTGLSFAPPC